jgi:hypothetical protein
MIDLMCGAMPKFILRFKGKPRKLEDSPSPSQHVKAYNEQNCWSLDRDFGEEERNLRIACILANMLNLTMSRIAARSTAILVKRKEI